MAGAILRCLAIKALELSLELMKDDMGTLKKLNNPRSHFSKGTYSPKGTNCCLK
jgi:hypothetical protein